MTTTPPIVLLGALEAEIATISQHMTEVRTRSWHDLVFYEGMLEGHTVVVAQSGVGKVFAAMVTQHLLDYYKPQYLLFTGVAGALNAAYEVGDVVVARDCVQHDMDATELGFLRGQVPYTHYRFFTPDAKLSALALQTPSGHTLHHGRVLTGDHFMTQKEVEGFDYLRGELAGDAIEMEGAAVGQVCTVNQVPFLLVRTISDKADGSALVNFTEFLPTVAQNTYAVLQYVLQQL
jgi:5'-methylthioadenosine/S-adenosylhomocysteine nucleosidase